MSASVWVSRPGSSRSTIGSSAATIAGSLDRGQARAQRQQGGADLHQRVGEHDLLAAAVHGQRRGRAAAHAVGGEAARDPGRFRLQLRVGDLVAVGDQRRAVGATLGSLGEPVVELHRRGYRAHHAQTPQGRPARRGALRPDRLAERRRVRRHPLREGRRDRQGDDRPARGAERLPAADADRGLAPRWRRRARTRGRRDRLHRRRRARRSAPAATRTSAATPATSPRAPRSAASTSPTCRSRCGGCRSRSSRWSPATRSAAATSSTSAAT